MIMMRITRKALMRSAAQSVAVFGIGMALFCVPQTALGAQPSSPSVPGLAPSSSDDLPAADEIFERYIEAIGGHEALDKLENRRIRGFFEGDPFEFKAELRIWWERDGRFHLRNSEPAGLRYDIYARDGKTWSVVQNAEPTPIIAIQRLELIDTADFLGEANYAKRYKEIQTLTEAKAGEIPVYVVRAVTQSGRPHTLFFAKESGLLLGTRVPVSDGRGGMRDLTVRLENYKDAGGVLYPMRMVQEFANGDRSNVYEFISVQTNVDDAHTYEVPESIEKFFEKAFAEEEKQKTSDED